METPAATATHILDAAERMAQQVGYGGLSFREIAAAVGIKSASVHYHFPSKARLGAALARRYTDRLAAHLAQAVAPGDDAATALDAYVRVFRATLESDGRMCLGGMMAAESSAVPEEVRAEVRRFVQVNVEWLAGVLVRGSEDAEKDAAVRGRALALFTALEGAMLIARGAGDRANFDRAVEQFGRFGLLPGSR